MADLTKLTTANSDGNSKLTAFYVSGLTAGDDLPKLAPCYLDDAGVLQLCVSTVKDDTDIAISVGEGAGELTGEITLSVSKFLGFTVKPFAAGDPVTLYGPGLIFSYGTVVPGANYYVSDTAGKLSDTPIVLGDKPVAVAISTTDLVCVCR
jgi:hypothetical protein